MREDAARRLGLLTLVTAAVVVGVEVLQALAQPELARVLADPFTRLATLAAVLLAIGISVTHRYRVVTPLTTLTLGMIFEIVVAFAIALVETSVPFTPGQAVLSSATMMAPGQRACTAAFSSRRNETASRFSRPPCTFGTQFPASRE